VGEDWVARNIPTLDECEFIITKKAGFNTEKIDAELAELLELM